jgi:hypothetical protein
MPVALVNSKIGHLVNCKIGPLADVWVGCMW